MQQRYFRQWTNKQIKKAVHASKYVKSTRLPNWLWTLTSIRSLPRQFCSRPRFFPPFHKWDTRVFTQEMLYWKERSLMSCDWLHESIILIIYYKRSPTTFGRITFFNNLVWVTMEKNVRCWCWCVTCIASFNARSSPKQTMFCGWRWIRVDPWKHLMSRHTNFDWSHEVL